MRATSFDFDHAVAAAPTVSPESAGLSRKLAEFLVEFATSVQKHAIYPPGHPLLETAVERLMRRLDPLLVAQKPVTFAVARTQLVIEGVATDPNNPLVRELAGRLHRHQLGAVKFLPGMMAGELTDFLGAVAVDPLILDRQIALTAQTERWPHFELLPVSYDRLEIMGQSSLTAEEATRAGATLMWIALARTALMGDDFSDDQVLDPATLARAIADTGEGNAEYDQSIVSFLMQITESLKGVGGGGGEESSELRGQVSELLRAMQPDSLERLLHMNGDVDTRKKFVLDASHHLAADAVLALVQAAAKASGHEISNTLLRLMGKLALQAEGGGAMQRAGATSALRDQVDSLVDGWEAKRLNPDSYQGALDTMSRRQVFTLMEQRQHPVEPHRMVCTGLEADTLGAAVWRAVDQMVTHGGIAKLLDMLDRAPEGSLVASELWPLVCTRENVRLLLREEQVDHRLLDRIAKRLGLDVVDMLLDALEHTETRTLRRKLLDLLAQFGSAIGPVVAERLARANNPWYVQRNLLTLLTMIPELPTGFAPRLFMGNKDGRVRREALKLLLRLPDQRDAAITSAITDSDDNIVQTALNAALERCPASAVPLIVRKVDGGRLQPATNVLAIKAVAAAKLEDTLPWLLHFVIGERRWYHRGERLAAKSPQMLAALSGLTASWSSDARVAPIVARAAQSRDSEIRNASTVRRRNGDRSDTLP